MTNPAATKKARLLQKKVKRPSMEEKLMAGMEIMPTVIRKQERIEPKKTNFIKITLFLSKVTAPCLAAQWIIQPGS